MKVLIIKTDEIKEIQEKEIIDGIEILYMTDNTSYSESQVFKFESALNYLKCCSDIRILKEVNENKRLIELFRDPEYKKKEEKEWSEFIKKIKNSKSTD